LGEQKKEKKKEKKEKRKGGRKTGREKGVEKGEKENKRNPKGERKKGRNQGIKWKKRDKIKKGQKEGKRKEKAARTSWGSMVQNGKFSAGTDWLRHEVEQRGLACRCMHFKAQEENCVRKAHSQGKKKSSNNSNKE
jgi:hypothetical protein